jgi:hypothetical protein
MIFDIKDAFLIAGGLILAVLFFVEWVTYSDKKETCEHKNWANYQSTGKQICIDCGVMKEIKKPHYPKHQR